MNSLISGIVQYANSFIYLWVGNGYHTIHAIIFFISDGLFHTEKKIILIWFQSCLNWFCHSLTYFHIKIQFCSLIKFNQINYKEEKLKKKKGVCENGMILYENSQLIVATFVHLPYTWFYSSNNVLITDFYPSF